MDVIKKDTPKASIIQETVAYVSGLLGASPMVNEKGEVIIDTDKLTFDNISQGMSHFFETNLRSSKRT